ncbi:MAG: TetR/AcrR family transcriptional regulator [Pseudonocardiales bacterium]|nr:MAG: TetR/AcrR family transcriptional regulator [Pseudonocardiales bacterium]
MSGNVNGPQSGSSRAELPVIDVGVVHERSDAARNRLRVLAAAERLFATRGAAGVTMDEVAAQAGVGKGTLYRRFGDKGGLAVALLDEREMELQARVLGGQPPLGPGALAADRLVAFVAAYLELVAAQLDLVLMSETSAPGARSRTGAHAFWGQHVRLLLSEAGVGDVDLRADVLLAALAAEQVRHWLDEDQRDLERVGSALAGVALALAQP